MVILVLNCGSSSIKYQVIDMEAAVAANCSPKVWSNASAFRKAISPTNPSARRSSNCTSRFPTTRRASAWCFDALTDPVHGVIRSLDEVKAVGHRVAHGGEFFPESCHRNRTGRRRRSARCSRSLRCTTRPTSKACFRSKKSCRACRRSAVFDTSFHQTIPAVNYMYALPHAYYEKYRVRKYGFHGTSHKYVAT